MLVSWNFLNVGELAETLPVIIIISKILYQRYQYTSSPYMQLSVLAIGASYWHGTFNRMRAGTLYRARTIPFNVF